MSKTNCRAREGAYPLRACESVVPGTSGAVVRSGPRRTSTAEASKGALARVSGFPDVTGRVLRFGPQLEQVEPETRAPAPFVSRCETRPLVPVRRLRVSAPAFIDVDRASRGVLDRSMVFAKRLRIVTHVFDPPAIRLLSRRNHFARSIPVHLSRSSRGTVRRFGVG